MHSYNNAYTIRATLAWLATWCASHATNKSADVQNDPVFSTRFLDKKIPIIQCNIMKCAGAMPYRREISPLPGSRHFKLLKKGMILPCNYFSVVMLCSSGCLSMFMGELCP